MIHDGFDGLCPSVLDTGSQGDAECFATCCKTRRCSFLLALTGPEIARSFDGSAAEQGLVDAVPGLVFEVCNHVTVLVVPEDPFEIRKTIFALGC